MGKEKNKNKKSKERYNLRKINYDWEKIGARIKFERENIDMTQEELAEAINVSRSTIIKWENARASAPSIRDLLLLCNFFNCELGYLLCEYDCKTRELTDICNKTGLSENAIQRILAWKRSGFGYFAMDVISKMIEDEELFPDLLHAGYDFWRIDDIKSEEPYNKVVPNGKLEVYAEKGTISEFYAFMIQKKLTDFVYSYFQINGGGNQNAEK